MFTEVTVTVDAIGDESCQDGTAPAPILVVANEVLMLCYFVTALIMNYYFEDYLVITNSHKFSHSPIIKIFGLQIFLRIFNCQMKQFRKDSLVASPYTRRFTQILDEAVGSHTHNYEFYVA